MSRGETSLVPSTSDGLGWRSLATPSRCAVSTTWFGSACTMSCAYAVLTECAVAVVRSMSPNDSPPKLLTVQGPAEVASVSDGGPGNREPSVTLPSSIAVASTIGLNDEP